MAHVDKGKLKRKKPPPSEEASGLIKKTSPEDLNTSNVTLMYPPFHIGTAVVEVKIKNELKKKTKNQNLMFIAKTISSLKAGATNMSPRSFGCAEITFPNKDYANAFVSSEEVGKRGLQAFIPRHRLEKTGLINVTEIINESISPCKITKATRLNRKAITLEGIEWVPSETVLVTFEGNTLPEYFKIFGLYNIKVHVYVEPLKMCRNCYRYGHTTKRCRSYKICAGCGSNPLIENHKCNESMCNKCLHCQGNHYIFSRECGHYQLNQKISEIMAYESKDFWEAKAQLEKDTNPLGKTSPPKETIDPVIRVNNREFPQPRQLSMSQEFKIKCIGGHAKTDTKSGSLWPTHKAITDQNNLTIKHSSKKVDTKLISSKATPTKGEASAKPQVKEENKENELPVIFPTTYKINAQVPNQKILLSSSPDNKINTTIVKQYKGKKHNGSTQDISMEL